MTKYVYLHNFRKANVKLGISTKVFEHIGERCLKNIPEILVKDSATLVTISVRNNTVVYKINIAIKKNINKEAIKEQIEDNLTNTMNFICDSMPFETHIKIVEKNA